jgi:methylated-DNA-[protein]-cysteine S-methyltransferase
MPEEVVFVSDYGLIRLIWTGTDTGPKVIRIILPKGSPAVSLAYKRSGEPAGNKPIDALVADIKAFLSGNNVIFGTGILDLDQCRPFQRRVLLAEFGIPRGYVSTYGRIARYLAVPGGARAVGNALARNPFPIVIPCHRALRSDGSVGGFQGGPAMKVRLLKMEGARFGPDGRVIMDHVWY